MPFSAFTTAFALLAGATALAALLLLYRRRREHARVLARLRNLGGEKEPASAPRRAAQTGVERWLQDLLWRAGIAPAPWQIAALTMALALGAVLGAWAHQGLGLVLYPALALGAIYLWLLRRAGQRQRLMIEQLPLFIDHLIRAVGAGNTLDSAIISAANGAREPLRAAFQRVAREIQWGGSLEEALEQSARTYDLVELRVLKLAVSVNRRYGSSIHDLLKSVVTMIRRTQAARREFRALTGETRLSAWVLGLMPIAIALYILMMSPDYIGVLWRDPAGRIMLGVAVSLQATGAFILWRMMRVF